MNRQKPTERNLGDWEEARARFRIAMEGGGVLTPHERRDIEDALDRGCARARVIHRSRQLGDGIANLALSETNIGPILAQLRMEAALAGC